MKIVDADIKQLASSRRSGRTRSAMTNKLIESVEDLQPGAAKAVELEAGETVQKIRARLTYSARVAGRKLSIAVDGNRVLFALKNRQKSVLESSDAMHRRNAVRAKALELISSHNEIKAGDILSALGADTVSSLDVSRPSTMIGAVLRSMPELERIGRNVFRLRV